MEADKRILLIEDNPIAQMAAKNLLMHAGFAVDAAGDGTDGIYLYRYFHYDVIILDIGLPDINGFEVAKRIRQYEKESHKTPIQIIALSASIDEYPQQAYKNAGINQVVSKPLAGDIAQTIQ